ncbi:MAG: hypothetical protein P4K83_08405 [Terracidiphilus sp.]|nr:hypothetical protein [Terracidiphilus sp.]
MKRRDFLAGAGAVAASACFGASRLLAQETGASKGALEAVLSIDWTRKSFTLPADYTGLSYESRQLANPKFFSAENRELIALFRELGSAGVLRIGGSTSEYTAFTTDEPKGEPLFEIAGPGLPANEYSETPITLCALENLRAFLDATGWSCLYGLNTGRGSVERAAEEAFYVHKILGPKLLALQLGNEPDAWRNRYRGATWSYEDYWKEWLVVRAAVLKRVSDAKFAGPDISNKIVYLTGFAADAAKSAPEVTLLTSHYYTMGPAGKPGMTIDKMLASDPKLERDMKTIMDAARAAHLPYRMCEGNTCWNGGQQGASDTLASALWSADAMLHFAALGTVGVNLHGGGLGHYTPIAGSPSKGFTRRPAFYGMLLAKEFFGATLVETKLECANDRVRAYAAEKRGAKLVLVVNKTDEPVSVKLPLKDVREVLTLDGPALDATDGTAITKRGAVRAGALQLGAHAAVVVKA